MRADLGLSKKDLTLGRKKKGFARLGEDLESLSLWRGEEEVGKREEGGHELQEKNTGGGGEKGFNHPFDTRHSHAKFYPAMSTLTVAGTGCVARHNLVVPLTVKFFYAPVAVTSANSHILKKK